MATRTDNDVTLTHAEAEEVSRLLLALAKREAEVARRLRPATAVCGATDSRPLSSARRRDRSPLVDVGGLTDDRQANRQG